MAKYLGEGTSLKRGRGEKSPLLFFVYFICNFRLLVRLFTPRSTDKKCHPLNAQMTKTANTSVAPKVRRAIPTTYRRLIRTLSGIQSATVQVEVYRPTFFPDWGDTDA